MVELRWYTNPSFRLSNGDEEVSVAGTTVLQYRFREPNAHELLHGIPPEYWVWSKWKEVPSQSGDEERE